MSTIAVKPARRNVPTERVAITVAMAQNRIATPLNTAVLARKTPVIVVAIIPNRQSAKMIV